MGYASAAAPARNGPLTEYLQAGRSGWMDNRGFTGGYEPLSDLTNRLNENGRKVLKKLYQIDKL